MRLMHDVRCFKVWADEQNISSNNILLEIESKTFFFYMRDFILFLGLRLLVLYDLIIEEVSSSS